MIEYIIKSLNQTKKRLRMELENEAEESTLLFSIRLNQERINNGILKRLSIGSSIFIDLPVKFEPLDFCGCEAINKSYIKVKDDYKPLLSQRIGKPFQYPTKTYRSSHLLFI